MTDRHINLVWGEIVAAALWQAGVKTVCVSPGSRSTPLVLGLHLFPKIEVVIHVDERSAAFFALGLAKSRQEPIGLLCTSGTAAANYFPAVIEASYSHIPLIILTADRPPELRSCGAPQTIDQMHLFGHHVRFFFEVGVPIASAFHFRYLETLIQYGVAIGVGKQGMPGPIHLNFPFAEPLAPKEIPAPLPSLTITPWQSLATEVHLTQATKEQLRSIFQAKRRGVIVVGVGNFSADLAPLLEKLSLCLGYPILGEATGISRQNVLSHYDSFLRSESVATVLAPEVILRWGALPTSKGYMQWLERYPSCQQILIGQFTNTDPTHGSVWHISMEGVACCEELLECLSPEVFALDRGWWDGWQRANHITAEILKTWMASLGEILFEGRIYDELAQWLPEKTIVHIANSTPIRDLDTFFHSHSLRVFANRGANGIDGTISSALGIAWGSKAPVLLICGDLSFYHDLNGLWAAKRYGISLTIVLIDNQGGGIFEMLPIAQLDPPFEEYFATPISLDFSAIVEGYGGTLIEVTTWQEFRRMVLQSLTSPGVQVVYLKTDRKRDWALRRGFYKLLDQELPRQLLL